MVTAVFDFHHGFDVPFTDRTTSGETTEGAYPFPVAIDGRGYIADLAKYERRTLAQLKTSTDTSNEPGEQSLEIEGVWKRTGTDAYLGAGQEFYDDVNSDRHQFFKSRGIDGWTRRKIHLLHDTTRVRTSANGALRLVKVGSSMVLVDGSQVLSTTTPLTGGWAVEDTAGSPVLSATTNGSKVYVACGAAGVRAITPGAGGVAFSAMQASMIVYANGWLIGGQANVLKSLDTLGAQTLVGSHLNPGFVWNSGTSAPNAIYVAGNAGDKGEIYRLTVDPQTGANLLPPVYAGEMPAGETINVISYYDGSMLIGTSKGLRVATVDSSGGLSPGPVIEEPSGQGVRCFDARGQYAWFGWANDYDTDHRGLARADLAHYTEAGVPAYSADLSANPAQVAGVTSAVAAWRVGTRDYHLFAVDGAGVFAEADTLVPEGAIDVGFLGQSSPVSKTLGAISVSHEALEGSITMLVTNEEGVQVDASSATQASYTSGDVNRTVSGELLDLTLVLDRSELDPTAGPILRRWTLSVIPAPPAVEEILLTILMGDHVRDSETGVTYPYDVYEEFFRLKEVENTRRVVTYREGQISYDVTVRSVEFPGVSYLGRQDRDWALKRRGLEGPMVVRMITLDGVPPRVGGI